MTPQAASSRSRSPQRGIPRVRPGTHVRGSQGAFPFSCLHKAAPCAALRAARDESAAGSCNFANAFGHGIADATRSPEKTESTPEPKKNAMPIEGEYRFTSSAQLGAVLGHDNYTKMMTPSLTDDQQMAADLGLGMLTPEAATVALDRYAAEQAGVPESVAAQRADFRQMMDEVNTQVDALAKTQGNLTFAEAYTVRKGDTLAGIAAKQYGDERAAAWVVASNDLDSSYKGIHGLQVGTELWLSPLPQDEAARSQVFDVGGKLLSRDHGQMIQEYGLPPN